MPERYHVPVAPSAGRFPRIGKYSIVDWREDCARCRNCVKNACISGIWPLERAHDLDPLASLEPAFDCRACLSCVQNCTKGILSLSVNPYYLTLGGRYWSRKMILTTWDQADSGRIPVSGAGYRGAFCGPGFDSMWTDMSEIVRPTRDGIHGREYISTSVDLGPKPLRVRFEANGGSESAGQIIELPLPLILDVPPWGRDGDNLLAARTSAAGTLGTLNVARATQIDDSDDLDHLAPLLEGEELRSRTDLLRRARFVEISDCDGAGELLRQAREANPRLVVAVRTPFTRNAGERLLQLYQAGVRVVHLCADESSLEVETPEPRYMRDALREAHGCLVQEGIRDEMTIIVSGGIALAEHMAKAIICGADLVAVGAALLVGLGCRVCEDGDHDANCPVQIQQVEAGYAAQRMVNLMGAWHSQLIEVLGAMGIREVRRLRGETGRAMFLEDLDREAFGDIGY
ncbi:MAG: glutamate synthase-related protein [Dehalococcoidia bacterium]